MADFVIKMAIAPAKVRFNLTQQELIETYETNIEQRIVRQLETYHEKYKDFFARFSVLQENREVSKCTQFRLLF